MSFYVDFSFEDTTEAVKQALISNCILAVTLTITSCPSCVTNESFDQIWKSFNLLFTKQTIELSFMVNQSLRSLFVLVNSPCPQSSNLGNMFIRSLFPLLAKNIEENAIKINSGGSVSFVFLEESVGTLIHLLKLLANETHRKIQLTTRKQVTWDCNYVQCRYAECDWRLGVFQITSTRETA